MLAESMGLGTFVMMEAGEYAHSSLCSAGLEARDLRLGSFTVTGYLSIASQKLTEERKLLGREMPLLD